MSGDERDALFEDVRYALRKLDPWPPKNPARAEEAPGDLLQ